MPIELIPQKVVSLAPSMTEIIFAIGREDILVGVTAQCRYPPKVVDLVRSRKLTTVGSYSITNLERIAALRPDLVMATSHSKKSTLEKLKHDGFNVMVFDYPNTVEGIFEIILSLGKHLGGEDRASLLIDSLRKRVESVEERARTETHCSVFFELSGDPLVTVSGGIWIGDMIRRAGGANIFEDRSEPFPRVQASEVMASDPEVMIVAAERPEDVDEVYAREGWGGIKAIRERRVIGVDASIANKPTPRAIDLFEKISELLR